jgi:hypothetical protein
MKYDGSGGVRASYSRTRLPYVRWTAMIFDGLAGARYVAFRLLDSRPVREDDLVSVDPAPALVAVDLDVDAAARGYRWAAYSSISHALTVSTSSSPTGRR